jgi:hypothetical protein
MLIDMTLTTCQIVMVLDMNFFYLAYFLSWQKHKIYQVKFNNLLEMGFVYGFIPEADFVSGIRGSSGAPENVVAVSCQTQRSNIPRSPYPGGSSCEKPRTSSRW